MSQGTAEASGPPAGALAEQPQSVLDFSHQNVAIVCVAAVVVLSASAVALGQGFPWLLGGLTLVSAAAATVRPMLGVVVAAFVAPTFAWVVAPGDISPFQAVVAATAVGTVAQHRAELGQLARRLLRDPIVISAGLFAACVVVSLVFVGGDVGYARNYVGAIVFLLVVTINVSTTARRQAVLIALIIGICGTAVVGLAQLVSRDALVSGYVLPWVAERYAEYNRLGSPVGLASVSSDYSKDVLVGVALALPTLAALRTRRSTLLMVALFALFSVSLVLSGSRSGWLAGVVAVALAVALARRRAVTVAGALLAAALCLCILRPSTPIDLQAAAGLPTLRAAAIADDSAAPPGEDNSSRPVATGRLGERTVESANASNLLRKRLNVAGWEMVKDKPLLGVGPGRFREVVDTYEPIGKYPRLDDKRPRLPPHNVVLGIWANTGTIAVLAYLAFMFLVWLRATRVALRTRGATAATAAAVSATIAALFVTSLFHNYEYDNLLWLMAGVSVALVPASRDRPDEQPLEPSVRA